jgi:hypothetical protein
MSAPSERAPGRPDLSTHADLPYQERTWRAQRAGWVIFLVILIAGALGAFGTGPFSRTTVGSRGDGFWVDYDRFARLLAPSELVVHVDRDRIAGDRMNLVLAGALAHAAEIESTTPRASAAAAVPDGIAMSFETRGERGDRRVVLHLKFKRAGPVNGRISLADGPVLPIGLWVHP